jgi:hypothetical protein
MRSGGNSVLTKRALLTVALFALACDDGPSGPNAVSGVFRLVSVNGQPVPWASPPSMGLLITVDHGDLHLRGNGTFGLGVGGSLGWFVSGQYRAFEDNRVRLMLTNGSAIDTMTLTVRGDSAVLTLTNRYVFKRVATPQTITPGIFVLAAINGRGPPLTEGDTVINGERYVARVQYDTVTFLDGMFYQRHRSESAVRYLASGDSVVGAAEWTNFGAHDRINGAVILRRYWTNSSEPRSDTLWTVGNDLVRRTQFIYGLQEDRYVRR